MIKFLVDLLTEFILLLIYPPLAGVVGYVWPLAKINSKPTQNYPVVVVHGWMTQNPFYCLVKRGLETRGYQVYMTNFGWQLGDLNRLSRWLREYIEKLDLI